MKDQMTNVPNPRMDLAYEFVCHTNRSVFLTGKAGTGKTTFLHRIRRQGFKRMVILAPTGVAAINAGGMTVHSFFQLPFGPQLPGGVREDAKRRFNSSKINLIRSLDLLVIDEISMVRADLLDGIDEVMRRYRDRHQPFGGVQLLLIGDLHQLSPVVKPDEWELLRSVYESPYFFSSKALQLAQPLFIELTHIYRQSDEEFIRLLNRVRDNQVDDRVLASLNSRYRPDFEPSAEDGFVTLTALNATAQRTNQQQLDRLSSASHIFLAQIEKEFPPHAHPTDIQLELKEGAQVMFIKNDGSADKRYYNGKIGRVTKIQQKKVFVLCQGETEPIEVQPDVWRNIRYKLNETTREVTEEELGTFTQYPLKLAWAITIHKSQGLTFDKVIIDAQASFAHGQVYVALSRCKSFDGIVLRSKIQLGSIRMDGTVSSFTTAAAQSGPDRDTLDSARKDHQQTLIRELFDMRDLRRYFEQSFRILQEHHRSLDGDPLHALREAMDLSRNRIFTVVDKFHAQLSFYFSLPEMPAEQQDLQDRIRKASAYFLDKLDGEILPAFRKVVVLSDNKAVLKTVLSVIERLDRELKMKHALFQACQEGFQSETYQRTRTDTAVEISESGKRKPAASSFEAAGLAQVAHPDLYTRLLQWRQERATDMGIKPYEVLPVKAVGEIVQYLPGNILALKKIRGFGDVKIQRYGPDVIELVAAYCQEKGIPTDKVAVRATPPVRPDTRKLTLKMFREGNSAESIAQSRGLSPATILGHLAHFVSSGELDVRLLLAEDAVEEIGTAIRQVESDSEGPLKASPVRELLGQKYAYGDIRLVMAHFESLRAG
ncbi:MAG: hypothetical protein RLY31_3092 [Bacteroidota bacterium]